MTIKIRSLLNGVKLEEVVDFVFLGCVMDSGNGRSVDDVAKRLQKAIHSLWNMSAVWITSCFSLKMFDSIIKSKLLYGCECWTLTKATEGRFQVFYLRCKRRILEIFYPNLISFQMICFTAKPVKEIL